MFVRDYVTGSAVPRSPGSECKEIKNTAASVNEYTALLNQADDEYITVVITSIVTRQPCSPQSD